MAKRILVAVDLTHEADAWSLIAEAGRIATLDGAHLSVATVLPDYGSSWVGTFFKDGALADAAEAARKALHNLVSEILPDLAPEVQCIVEIGTAYKEILHAAKQAEADLIVVGAHKPDLADRVIGPNAARVSRYADVSVLVVRI